MTATVALGPESALLLQQVQDRLRAAQQVLAAQVTMPAVVKPLERWLFDTDELFARLVGCWDLGGHAAQQIEGVRENLGAHLVAAVDLDVAEVPSATILRRAVAAALSEVEALIAGAKFGQLGSPGEVASDNRHS